MIGESFFGAVTGYSFFDFYRCDDSSCNAQYDGQHAHHKESPYPRMSGKTEGACQCDRDNSQIDQYPDPQDVVVSHASHALRLSGGAQAVRYWTKADTSSVRITTLSEYKAKKRVYTTNSCGKQVQNSTKRSAIVSYLMPGVYLSSV